MIFLVKKVQCTSVAGLIGRLLLGLLLRLGDHLCSLHYALPQEITILLRSLHPACIKTRRLIGL